MSGEVFVGLFLTPATSLTRDVRLGMRYLVAHTLDRCGGLRPCSEQ